MEKNDHLESLDALRGFDMMLISGVGMTTLGFCLLFPGGGDCWIANQFKHAKWEGLSLWDTIFPLFIFIAGVSFPFSFARQRERGDSAWHMHGLEQLLSRGAWRNFSQTRSLSLALAFS